MEQPGTLIKFGELEHLQQLREEGLLYMNNLPYFWNIKDGGLRGDPFDCAKQVIRGPKVTMFKPDGNEATICRDYIARIRPPKPEKTNIFCMYALRPLIEGAFPVTKKSQRFGDHVLILMDGNKFIQRLESSLKSQMIEGDAALIEYVNDEHIGEMGPFRKFNRFSFQYEWRLACYDGPGGPRIIRIGSIQDISVILPTDEINKQIQIHFEPVAEPDRP